MQPYESLSPDLHSTNISCLKPNERPLCGQFSVKNRPYIILTRKEKSDQLWVSVSSENFLEFVLL